MSFDLGAFEASLCAAAAAGARAPYCVALSGGLDSTVVLHALIECRGVADVRAVHVDHGLHPDSAQWSGHCRRLCAALGVGFDDRSVTVARRAGESPEAAAREARYLALADALRQGETLVTGHHADDQLETVLLQLLRGAGTAGLAAMPAVTAFPPGRHLRPLIRWTRDELTAWARARGLEWLEDPSNRETGFDRNYLRHEVLPAVLSRWPGAAKSVVRSARLCAEATRLTEVLAAEDLDHVRTSGGVRAEPIAGMSPERSRNLLRFWLAKAVGRAPDSRRLESIVANVLAARVDSMPEVRWNAGAVRRYRGELIALDAATVAALDRPPETVTWGVDQPLDLGPPFGSLRVVRSGGRGLAPEWLESGVLQVRFRAGGESIQPVGTACRRPLKKLFQEAGVPPWWRNRVPLLYSGDRLLAAGDLWVEDSACRDDARSWRLEWRSRPAAIVVPTAIW
jgi:tRNA(Ile)-lysidine synthase